MVSDGHVGPPRADLGSAGQQVQRRIDGLDQSPCHRANQCLPSSSPRFADYIEAKLRNAGHGGSHYMVMHTAGVTVATVDKHKQVRAIGETVMLSRT